MLRAYIPCIVDLVSEAIRSPFLETITAETITATVYSRIENNYKVAVVFAVFSSKWFSGLEDL